MSAGPFAWRPMAESDVPAVTTLADRIHPDLPEGEATFANRLALFPAGCFVLADGAGAPSGYAVAHPVVGDALPKLDTALDVLPEHPDALLLHDVALEAGARGTGAAGEIVRALLRLAEPYGRAVLVSVHGTAPFWARHGFAPAPAPAGLAEAYGAEAVFMVRVCP